MERAGLFRYGTTIRRVGLNLRLLPPLETVFAISNAAARINMYVRRVRALWLNAASEIAKPWTLFSLRRALAYVPIADEPFYSSKSPLRCENNSQPRTPRRAPSHNRDGSVTLNVANQKRSHSDSKA